MSYTYFYFQHKTTWANWIDNMDSFLQSQYLQSFHLCAAWVKHQTSFIQRLFFWLFTVSQVESMNIHELPWHINQMNYAAWFTEPNPHVQANNFQCHPVQVFCHHHRGHLCHNLDRWWHRPMGRGWRNVCLLTSVWGGNVQAIKS